MLKNWAMGLFFALLFAGVGEGEADAFVWPIEFQPVLSSTFGETRSASFHAGIDLKTWGRTGCAVRALADGCVIRLRTSPWGYGRAVYQRLANGQIAVYAHLQGFAPALAARVEAAQEEKGQYSVDLWFAEGELPVRRGEVIAWTGQSGIGPPHLHLELREGEDEPVNPLLHGLVVPDSVAPVLQRVALVPLGCESLVEGGHEPVSLELRWDADERIFAARETLRAFGCLGVGLLAYDRGNAAPNELAPYRTALRVDGQPVFAAAYDRFSYGDAHLVRLDRLRLAFAGGSGDFFALFRLPGNRLKFYREAIGEGFLACGGGREGLWLAKGLHFVEVEAADAAGNRSQGRFRLLVDAPPAVTVRQREEKAALEVKVQDPDDPELEAALAHSADGRTWEVVERRTVASGSWEWSLPKGSSFWQVRVRDPGGAESLAAGTLGSKGSALSAPRLEIRQRVYPDWVELIAISDQFLTQTPQALARGKALKVRQVGVQEYRIEVPLQVGGAEILTVQIEAVGQGGIRVREEVLLSQRAVLPGREQRLSFGHEAELIFAKQSACSPFFPQGKPFRPERPRYLESLGVGCDFAPASVALDAKVEVRLRYPEGFADPEKLGVYRESEEGGWNLVGNALDRQERTVAAQVRQLGRFALMADREPPRIERMQPAPGKRVEERRPRLVAWIEDRGAGIGREEDIALKLDGRRLIGEYDPEAGTVEYQLKSDLKPGKHLLEVWVRDQSGNEAAAQSQFTVK